MASGIYDLYPAAAISIIEGFVIEPENYLEIGDSNLWGSLQNTGVIYDVYAASVGLQEDSGSQIGACNDVSFERNRTIEAVEVGNIVDSGLFRITDEENNVVFTALEWRAANIALAFGSSYQVINADNGLIEFGGGCTIDSRPMVVRGSNVSCSAPNITSLLDGVKYFTLTLYDCYSSEGATLPIAASEQEGIEITMRAKPVLTLDEGQRIGNLYLAAA